MDERPLNVVSVPKKDFDRQKVKPDNYLYFVYDEYKGEDGKPKTRIRLYKGNVLVSGDVNITNIIQGEGGGNTLEAGKAYFLEPFEEPVINIRDGKYIDVGIPRAPFVLTEEVELTEADYEDHYSIGIPYDRVKFSTDEKGNVIRNFGLSKDSIDPSVGPFLQQKIIYKNTTNRPCILQVPTFPPSDNYDSGSDNVMLIPPYGRGIVIHSPSHQPHFGYGVSEVYPKMRTTPKVIYEVMFKGTDNEVYDSVNNFKTEISGDNLVYNENIGLQGDSINIKIVNTESIDGYNKRNNLNDILYPYAFQFVVHVIGEEDSLHYANAKGIKHGGAAAMKGGLQKGNIAVISPYRTYITDNLDAYKTDTYTIEGDCVLLFYEDGIVEMNVGIINNKTVKGIRIIAGAPADILRSPEFLTYKFD